MQPRGDPQDEGDDQNGWATARQTGPSAEKAKEGPAEPRNEGKERQSRPPEPAKWDPDEERPRDQEEDPKGAPASNDPR